MESKSQTRSDLEEIVRRARSIGYQEGYEHGRREATDEADETIRDLERQLADATHKPPVGADGIELQVGQIVEGGDGQLWEIDWIGTKAGHAHHPIHVHKVALMDSSIGSSKIVWPYDHIKRQLKAEWCVQYDKSKPGAQPIQLSAELSPERELLLRLSGFITRRFAMDLSDSEHESFEHLEKLVRGAGARKG